MLPRRVGIQMNVLRRIKLRSSVSSSIPIDENRFHPSVPGNFFVLIANMCESKRAAARRSSVISKQNCSDFI